MMQRVCVVGVSREEEKSEKEGERDEKGGDNAGRGMENCSGGATKARFVISRPGERESLKKRQRISAVRAPTASGHKLPRRGRIERRPWA